MRERNYFIVLYAKRDIKHRSGFLCEPVVGELLVNDLIKQSYKYKLGLINATLS